MKLQEAISSTSAGAMQHAYKNAIDDILDSSKVQRIPVKKAYDLWTKQTTFGSKAKKEVWRIVKRVAAANETAVRDSSGEGEARNQRGTRDHARGTAPEGEEWLKANPRNEW